MHKNATSITNSNSWAPVLYGICRMPHIMDCATFIRLAGFILMNVGRAGLK